MRRTTRSLVAPTVALGVCLAAAAAFAFWATTGTGTATTTVGTLATPTNVAAGSPGWGASVPVSWTGVVPPVGATVDGYYVQRFSGSTPSPACASSPSALLPPAPTSCTDAGLANGTYTYKVTAVFHSWTSTSAASASVTVSALASFTVSAPASATAGSPFTVTVTPKSSSNATITAYRGTVHFTTTDPGGAVMPADYTFVAGDNGAHSFTNGVTLKTVPNQTVAVNDAADVTKTGSTSVSVTAGAATQLAFTQQPNGGLYTTAWTTQPKVTVQDALGNTVTTSTASVTLAIGTNPGGGTLTCTANPKAAVSGVVTFAGCRINKPGTGYTLTATATGLTGTTSATFDVTPGPATKVVFTQQPTAVVAGASISPSVTAAIQDAGSNIVTSSNATIVIAIGTNPGSGTLSGTTSLNAVNGIATFTNLSVNKSGTGYTLVASSTGLTSVTSSTFNVTAGAATQLAFTQQPNGGLYTTAWTTQPKVTVQDALGNTVTTSTASVTLAIGTNPGGGTLTCTANPKAAVAGVVTFAGCKINKPGTGYTLTATTTGLTSTTSATFDVTPGPATKVVYTQQPTAVVAGTSISPSVTAAIQDAGSNIVTSSNALVTIAIGTNPGSGTLSGTTSLNAVNGIATFTNLSVNKSGTGYTLVASSTGLTSVTSSTFNVTAGAATQLAFTQQPNGGARNVAWTTQPKVTVQDALGNTVTTSTASVTLAIGTNPGGGTLTCTANPQSAVAGVATFAGCKINLAGTGYTLTATATGLTPATSSAFTIT